MTSVLLMVRQGWLPSPHSQSGFSRLRERGSRKQSVKHFWKWKEGLKRYLISAHCVTTAYTPTWAHTGKKTYMCTHTCTQTHTTSQTPNVLHPLLLTLTPSEPSQHPPLHSLIHSLPNCPFISLFLAMHMVQKLYFWLTRLEHKGSSYASWRSPTREASIPSWIERVHTDRVSPLFFSLPFPYRIKPLGFWMVCTISPHPTPTAFSRSELNDQLDNQFINELFLMSVHAHCRVQRMPSGWVSLESAPRGVSFSCCTVAPCFHPPGFNRDKRTSNSI